MSIYIFFTAFFVYLIVQIPLVIADGVFSVLLNKVTTNYKLLHLIYFKLVIFMVTLLMFYMNWKFNLENYYKVFPYLHEMITQRLTFAFFIVFVSICSIIFYLLNYFRSKSPCNHCGAVSFVILFIQTEFLSIVSISWVIIAADA